MSAEKFCLRWNDFENNISCAFKELRDDKDFFDVTLACGDEEIQAHKVILSACSPFFKTILRRHPHQHPLLYLHGVSCTDLQSVLNFMYHGEVNVAQEELNTFLAVAENLKVKGLTQQSKSGLKERQQNDPPKNQAVPAPHVKEKSTPKHSQPKQPLSLAASRSLNNTAQAVEEEEIQEVIPIKSEPKDLPPPNPTFATSEQPHYNHRNTLATADDQTLDYTVENYDDYGEYPHQYTEEQAGMSTGAVGIASGQSFQDPSELLQFVEQDKSDLSKRRYVCTICNNFYHQGKSNVRNHVECKHFPDSFLYNCELCGNGLPSKAALQKHKHKVHRYM